MGDVLDIFRDPPEVSELAVTYTQPFTGGFTGGPPCNPQLDDIAGNNAFFNALCVGSFNQNPALQMQPGKSFFGRLFDTSVAQQTCPINVFTRLKFYQFAANDTKFVPLPAAVPYDRIQLPTYTQPALAIGVFINVAGNNPQPTSMQLGLIDDANNISVAINVTPSIGFAGTLVLLAATASTIGLAVNPATNPFVTAPTVTWPTMQIFVIGQV